MLSKIHILKTLISAIAILLFISTQSFALEDAIVAVVNDEVITLKDIQEYLNSAYLQLTAEGRTPSQIEQIMKSLETKSVFKLIEDKLLLAEANQQGLTVRKETVDKKMEELKKQYPTEQQFINALLEDGLSVTDLRKRVEDQLKIKYIVDHEINSKIFVNPQEVTEFYEENLDLFKKPEGVDLDSIAILFSDDKELAKQKSEDALKLLQDGKTFEDVAKTYSQIPSVGIINKGQLLANVESVIFNLNVDEISPIIELENGYYIFKVKEKIIGHTATREEVKDYITNLIYQEKFKERLTAWIKKLKNRAYIDIKDFDSNFF